MRIYLGNGDSVTLVDTPDDNPILGVLSDVRDLWSYHADEDASWVASDNDVVATALAQQFNTQIKTFQDAESLYDQAAGSPSVMSLKESAK